MKFTFICEDEEDGTKVVYECNEIQWTKTLEHYHNFLNGCGFIVDQRLMLDLVEGEY